MILSELLEMFGIETLRYKHWLSKCKDLYTSMQGERLRFKNRLQEIDDEISNLDRSNFITMHLNKRLNLSSEKFHYNMAIKDYDKEILNLSKLLTSIDNKELSISSSITKLKNQYFFARTTVNACHLGKSNMLSFRTGCHSSRVRDINWQTYEHRENALIRETE